MKTLELPSLSTSRSLPRPNLRGAGELTPTRKTAIIGGVVLGAALIAAWFLVLKPRAADVTAVQEQTAAAAAANDSLRNQIAGRKAQEAQLPTMRSLSEALSARFPATAEQRKFFAMITAAAGNAGIAPQYVTNVTVAPPADASAGAGNATAALPGVATPIGRIASQTVTLDVRGSEAKVRKFVANLEKLPRAFQVTSLNISIQSSAGGGGGNAAGAASGGGGNAAAAGGNTTAAIIGTVYLMPEFVDPTKAAAK